MRGRDVCETGVGAVEEVGRYPRALTTRRGSVFLGEGHDLSGESPDGGTGTCTNLPVGSGGKTPRVDSPAEQTTETVLNDDGWAGGSIGHGQGPRRRRRGDLWSVRDAGSGSADETQEGRSGPGPCFVRELPAVELTHFLATRSLTSVSRS